MKTLPKYFIILRDAANPLWDKYIQWIFDTYKEKWTGKPQGYYGYDGSKQYNGTNVYGSPKSFKNNPTIITLDYWNECVNGFQLPKYWYIENKYQEVRDYLSGTYREPEVKGWAYDYIGYDGASSYNGIHGVAHVDWFKNSPVKLTIEQFKKYVLKQEDMKEYKFTPEYCKTHKVAIHVDTPEEVKLCDILLNNNSAHAYLYERLSYKENNQAICCKDSSHCSVEWFEANSYEVIKAKDFINLNTKTVEKKLIGYKLIKPEMLLTASIILYGNPAGSAQLGRILTDEDYIAKLKKAGVLGIWFEPVYENVLESMVKEFTAKTGIKVGSTIVAPGIIGGEIAWDDRERWRESTAAGSRIVEKFSIHSDGTTLLMKVSGTSSDVWFDAYKMKLASKVPSINIKGYKAEFTKDSVKFGCQTYSKEFVLTLAKCLTDNGFDMDIKREIVEIAEYFKS